MDLFVFRTIRPPANWRYFMEELYNPVYNALLSGDLNLAHGSGAVRYFHPEVSPFVGFEFGYATAFRDLHDQLPDDRKIIHANPQKIQEPEGWRMLVAMEGLQFIYEGKQLITQSKYDLVPLTVNHIEEMVALALLTKPGPFGKRTIEFGHYHGIFSDGKLVAMAGQRMHVNNHTEISAVCTHPDHLGKGYAVTLMQHQINIILSHGQKPFLHVRADNERPIALYKKLGFRVTREMNFYFLQKV